MRRKKAVKSIYLSSPRRIEKTNLIFYFHTYLWYLKKIFWSLKSNQYCNRKTPLNLFQRVIFKELPWLRRAKSITSISGLKPLAKVKAVLNTREDEREESSKKYLSSPRRIEKTNLLFYFHTSVWYLKRFFEGLKGFNKPLETTQRRVKIKI